MTTPVSGSTAKVSTPEIQALNNAINPGESDALALQKFLTKHSFTEPVSYFIHEDGGEKGKFDGGDCIALENEKGETITLYNIAKGDSLSEIAKKFHFSEDKIAKLNGIKDKSKIKAGDIIQMPNFCQCHLDGEAESCDHDYWFNDLGINIKSKK